MKLLTVVRLCLSAILLGTASLAVFPAPTHLLWMLAIGATEWGHVLGLICLGAGVVLWSSDWSGRLASMLAIAAAILAFTPVLRATLMARQLPEQLRGAFAEALPTRLAPLVYGDLFRGLSPQDIRPETLVYSRIQDMELSLDFYRASSPLPAPLIVVIHGGSWVSGDNKDFIPANQYFAGRGYAVADTLYRLAPGSPFPAAVDDIRVAIEFLRGRANELNIDPHRIVLLGRSAGGQIALTLAYSAKDPGIRGVISFYAPADLRWSWDHPGNSWVIDTKSVLKDYLSGTPVEAGIRYDAASPVRLVTSKAPPTLLFHGGRDELVSSYQGVLLAKQLAASGVPHLNVVLPWATHGFDYILRGPGGQLSTYAIEYFLARVTAPKT